MLGEVAGILVGVPVKFRHSGARFNRRLPDAAFGLAVLGPDHFGVEFEQLFQPFGVIAEAPADIDAFQRLIIAIMGSGVNPRGSVR